MRLLSRIQALLPGTTTPALPSLRDAPSKPRAHRESLELIEAMKPGTTLHVSADHHCGRLAYAQSFEWRKGIGGGGCRMATAVSAANKTLAPAIWSSRHFADGSVGIARYR